ncbi:formimidoylglutamase [Hydrotalea sp.]|uniref:formimidoylglutamase n=1 Tax=Hydrotalea sp. TaxID=2881279 RepID=UPI003D10FEF1
MPYLHLFKKEDILSLVRIRRYETKLGERLQTVLTGVQFRDAIADSDADFVVLGIPEDIGVKANEGVGGTNTAWNAFLQSFLNIQSNDFLDGREILMAGYFDFSSLVDVIEINAFNYEEKIDAYRHAVNTIDDTVEQYIHEITQQKKIPIIIGGGHNNAYPCIKGAAKGWYKAGIIDLPQINVVNLDAHADYRAMEGRHSGNAFRYAEEDGYLEKYCILGLHENYISQNIWMDIVNNPFIDCITYEDIFLHEKRSFQQSLAHAAAFTEGGLCGIELDVDAIENTLSSAGSPTGISPINARQYLNFMAWNTRPAYLHICEAATRMEDGRQSNTTGKLLSYLVSDFVKAMVAQF